MKIAEIDHIHLYVEDIAQAEQWYNAVLGFSRDVSLGFWAEQGGPRVIRNNRASLSLFLRTTQPPGHTVAFSVAAPAFSTLIPVLRKNSIPFSISDHEVSMSIYFNDPSENKIEVTSYDYSQAKSILARFA